MNNKCDETNFKILAACKRAFDFADDEFNNRSFLLCWWSFPLC
jgi:hypothetical protein